LQRELERCQAQQPPTQTGATPASTTTTTECRFERKEKKKMERELVSVSYTFFLCTDTPDKQILVFSSFFPPHLKICLTSGLYYKSFTIINYNPAIEI